MKSVVFQHSVPAQKMYRSLLVFYVVIFSQGSESRIHKRSPQEIDIQSIRQKQITPEITVVDVVVNEPNRRGYPGQNQYVPQQGRYPVQGNFYPNNQYQNIPNRRQPEIQIIEVIDPRQQPVNNFQGWQRYPQGGQFYPNTNVQNQYPGGNNPYQRPNRPNRRRYRPNTDFYIPDYNGEEDYLPGPPPNRRPGPGPRDPPEPGHRGPPGPGHRGPPGPGHRGPPGPGGPKPPRPGDDSSEEDEKYVFDAGEGTVVGYTKENFPIIPLHKNDIRR